MSELHNIEKSLLHILDRTSWIETVDDFFKTPAGVDALDIAAIRLMAVGEEIKKIEKRSGGEKNKITTKFFYNLLNID
ncbi:MAG: hypothetical protein ABFC30_06140 [Proteiniphilum sp.]